MPRIHRLAGLTLALLLSSATGIRAQGHAHAGHAPASSPEAAVAQTIQALFAAAERGDLRALDSLYAGDSLLVIEGAGINRGWADYRDNHLAPELKEFTNFRYRPFEIEARVSGAMAWATFRYALTADLPDRKVDVVGRGTAILERQGNRWVVRLTQTASRARRPSDPPMP
ncbi:MAG: nuclear transport factor 2 family protein [Gemmatimonadaceae bacterium]|nr:nuclear transport factor 2 family protein [Gemmatimonadaceae bacterium]